MILIMSTSPSSIQPLKTPLHWPSLIQFVLSALVGFLLLGVATIIALTSLAQYFASGSGGSDPTQSLMVAASLAFVGVLVLPSAWYAWRHIAHPDIEPIYRPEPRNFGLILTILVIVLVGGALLLGNWVSQYSSIAWVLLPLLNIIATGLPTLWIVYIGTRGLLPSSPRRTWGVFASGLVLGPTIILILEIILLIGMGILALLWIMLDPSLANQLNGLVFRLENAVSNPDAILNILLPFLLNPVVLFLGFASITVLVPMIEETFKPIGVWFLAGQKISPAQGFGYGVISGAGFALFENLGNTSSGGEVWALVAGSRISTLLLHCFTAGLVGWALASAWRQRRYLRLAVTYAIAVLVHGLWNGLAVLSAASSLQGMTNIPLPANLQQIGAFASVGIIALGVIVFVLFISFNSILRRNQETMPPPSSGDGQASNPPGEASQPSSAIESSLPTTEINSPFPIPPRDNPPMPESDSHPQVAGEIPPTAPESNI